MKTTPLLTLFLLFSFVSRAQWSTASLSEGKYEMEAVRVGNRLLIVGGALENGGPATRKVEIYDPSTDSWSVENFSDYSAGNLKSAVTGQWAMFANGSYTLTGKLFLYNSTTNEWKTLDHANHRFGYAFGAVGNKFFFAGGKSLGSVTKKVDIYNAETDEWTSQDLLSEAREDPKAVTVGNKIFFIGGVININVSQLSKRVDVYDHDTNTWSSFEISVARKNMGAAVVGNKIVLAGGQPTNNLSLSQLSKAVDIIDAVTNTSTAGANISAPNSEMASAVIGDRAIFLGGYSNIAEVLDLNTGVWQSTPLAATNLYFVQAATLGKKAFFAGGSVQDSKNVFIFDGNTGMWDKYILANPHTDGSVASIGTKLFIAGGRTGLLNPFVSDVIDVFTDPSAGSFEALESQAITLYPNPASDILRFELPADWNPGQVNFQLYSLDGRLLKSAELLAPIAEIDPKLKGMYLVKLHSSSKFWIGKVMLD